MMDLAGAVAAVAPVVVEGRAEAERLRRLPASTLCALEKSGLLTAKVPETLGGCDADLPSLFDALEPLAYADGSAAWITGFMGTSAAWPGSRLDDDGVEELMSASGSWPLLAGTFVHSGRATPEGDSYRLEGTWRLASGIRHASWVVSGCVRSDTGAQLWCVVPTADLTVHDTWHSLGLRGTGSCDYSINDVLVPARRTFSIFDPPLRGGPLHHLPILAFLTPDHSAIALGCARRAMEESGRGAIGNRRVPSAAALADRPSFRRDLGRADTLLASARQVVREVIDKVWGAASAGHEVGPELQVECRTAAALAAEVAVEVATFAHRAGGARAIVGDSTINHAYRDVMTATQHVYVSDEVYEQRGATILERLAAESAQPEA
jgi:alkylation response protein AidB-like acyl-CoA dehydrogenase